MHILMLLSNAYKPDPRVAREAQALARHGYQVSVLCWDRQGKLPTQESHNEVEIIRIQSVRSAHGSGWRQLFYLPRFWQAAVKQGSQLRPNIVHCHDLDTLYIGWRLKSKLHCPLVYDAHENYPAVMSLYLPVPFIFGLRLWERWLMRHVDAILTASTVLRDEFLSQGFSPVITIGNYQDTSLYQNVTETQTRALRLELGVKPQELLIVYIGGLTRDRVILPLIEAAASLPQVQCHIWGNGPQRAAIEQAITQVPNAHYHGWLSSADLPCHFVAADVVFYCLRPDYPGAVYNAPNTLSQAMAAGRPLIANDVGDLGRIVRHFGCGLLISDATSKAIQQAIATLRDPLVRQHMGERGLATARESLNWAVAEKSLLGLYHRWQN